MKSPSELQAELEAQVAQRMAKVRALEAERGQLLLAAVSGDAKAMRRTAVVKREVADHAAALTDLDRALGDLEPLVAREHLEANHARRRQLVAQLNETLNRAGPAMARIDAAIAELAAAVGAAAPLMDAARFLVADITVRQTGNVTEMAINRMLSHDSTVFRALPALIEGRLARAQLIPVTGIPPVALSLAENGEGGAADSGRCGR